MKYNCLKLKLKGFNEKALFDGKGFLQGFTFYHRSVPLQLKILHAANKSIQRGIPTTIFGSQICIENRNEQLKILDVRPTIRNYYRTSWFTWWAQIILSVVSGSIITFANIVRQTTVKDYSFWFSGFEI